MKVIISHPTSNENSRAAALGLLEANQLQSFHTAIATFPGTLLDRLSDIKPLAELKRRRFLPELKPMTHTYPWFEAGRQLSIKAGLKRFVQHETGLFCVDAVYKNLDKSVAVDMQRAKKKGATAVYAYLDGALYSFREAKRLGLDCIYDLPIGYWRTAQRMLSAEQDRWPDWASTMTGLVDSQEKLNRQDEELQLSDRIVVASQFTASTLKDYPGKLPPIAIVPYGFPTVTVDQPKTINVSGKNRLKLLFVGGLSQRKGIADIFEAVKGLEDYVELTVVGLKAGPGCAALDEALSKHTWIPSLPHDEVLKLMREKDVLLFPSLFEGFGLVITEAMSQGMPVITTDRTAGPDVINHGENGWLVEAGNTNALKAAIEELIVQPQFVHDASQEALTSARQRPWSAYRTELINALSLPTDALRY
jgi:glycosyltransferase involved in cell wall biosynthesis